METRGRGQPVGQGRRHALTELERQASETCAAHDSVHKELLRVLAAAQALGGPSVTLQAIEDVVFDERRIPVRDRATLLAKSVRQDPWAEVAISPPCSMPDELGLVNCRSDVHYLGRSLGAGADGVVESVIVRGRLAAIKRAKVRCCCML